jgi:N utilization substance protein B
MSNRHLARTVAMQTLYEWDFTHSLHENKVGEDDKQTLADLIKTNLQEFAPGLDDEGFAKELVTGVVENIEQIDPYIIKYAPEWPIEQITNVDRNILRLAIYEMLVKADVPAKVAINEAIELAKAFGGESSGRFVNGVLGAIYKDIDESHKDVKT